jgi:hypothetical protein
MKPVPIKAAQSIAEEFGYHQVIVIARAIGPDGKEHVTTFGVDAKNCAAAAMASDFLKFKVMGWASEETHEDLRYAALTKTLEDILDAVDDLRLVDRLKEIERIATAGLLEARGGPKRSSP